MDKSLAITGEDGGVYGIPYVVEGYGIIYNDAIMQKYFALDGAKAASMDEINNFAKLKEVVEDMQAKKDELGIEGVFASTSLTPGEDWRWQTHLANIPVYYEFKDKGITDTDNLEFTYSDNFKNIFDLYINNSCTAPGLLGSKSVDDSMAEFALGQAAMVQNGNWGWSQINGVDGNTVKAEDVKFLPIYTGVEGEENQGLCTGTENFFCINKEASAEDQAASIAFVEWLFSSETGKAAVTNDLGFIAPFDTFSDDEKPTDPLAQEVLRYMADTSKTSVSWNFTSFPSQQFKDDFGAALLEYASGSIDWDGKYSDKCRPPESCEKTGFFNTVHIVGQSHKGLCGRQCKRIVADEQFSLKGVDQHEENRCQKCNYQQTQDTKYDHIGSFFLSHYCSTSLFLV